MPYGGGGSVITMPTSPWPKSLEIRNLRLAAANTGAFNAQQQIQDWGVSYQEISVSFASMTQAQVGAWVTFLNALNGVVNVFQFPGAVQSKFSESLPASGYWRLKKSEVQWNINPGSIYRGLTFEARTAI